MRSVITWFKTLFRIVRYYDQNYKSLVKHLTQTDDIIKQRTEIHADINMKGSNHIIMIGRFHHKDYVQTFTIPNSDFEQIIQILRDMSRYGSVKRIDAPPLMSTVFKQELQL